VQYIRGSAGGASRALNFLIFLGYFSGLYFIRPDFDAVTLVRTATLIHALDAGLCRVMAGQSGRNRLLWTVAGLLLGVWALGALFVLPSKKSGAK
jgi:hypothetical protein